MAIRFVALTSGTSWNATFTGNVKVHLIGGGGGCKTNSSAAWSGGGGGAYAGLNAFAVTSGNSYTYAIGAAGTTGGADGGDTSWNSGTGLAKGGKTALSATAAAGGLASSSTGDTTRDGGSGHAPSGSTGGGGGAAASPLAAGTSAPSTTGAAALGYVFTQSSDGSTYPTGGGGNGGSTGSAGSAGTVYGGGSGGAGSSAFDGTAGKAGLIVLEYDDGIAIPQVRSVGAVASGTAGIAATLPASHQADDILLLFTETANENVSAPTGYTEVTGSPQGTGTAAGTSAARLQVFWKRDSGSESNPSIADPGDHVEALMMAVSGCVTSGDPWDVTAGATAATSTSVSFPSVTTTVANCLIVNAIASMVDAATARLSGSANAGLSYVFEQADVGTTSGNGGGIAVVTGEKYTAGSTGSTTATLSATSVQGLLTLALKPATTGTSYNQSVGAASTPSLVLARSGAKPRAATSTPTLSILRGAAKARLATTTPLRTLSRSAAKPAAGTSTSVPGLVASASRPAAVPALSTPAAAVIAAVARGVQLASASTVAGSVIRAVQRRVQATSTPPASLARLGALFRSVAVASTSAPSLLKGRPQALGAATTPTVAILRRAPQPVAAASQPASNLVRGTGRRTSITGDAAPALGRYVGAARGAVSTPVGTLQGIRVRLQAVSAASNPVGALSRLPAKVLRTAAALMAALYRGAGRALAAAGLAEAVLHLVRPFGWEPKGPATETWTTAEPPAAAWAPAAPAPEAWASLSSDSEAWTEHAATPEPWSST